MQPTIDVFNPFERFEIQTVLKTLPNGRSNCWRGRNRESGEVVVLKLYDGTITDKAARQWAERRWEGWVRFLEIFPEQRSVFCAREWIEGITLADALERRDSLPAEEHARHLFARIADRLALLHAEGRAHGQIKSTNILLSDGQVLLADALITDPPAAPAPGATVDLGRSIAGIPHYLNPEIIRDEPQTPASDIYSLACLLYEWLAGDPPFRGDNDVLVCYEHLCRAPEALAKARSDLSAACQRLVDKALAKEPAARFVDAAQFANALREGLTTPAPERIELDLRPEARRHHYTHLPSARTTVLSAKDLETARAIMREAPTLGLDEVRARILALQGDPSDGRRIPGIAFTAEQTRKLRERAARKATAPETIEIDPEELQRFVARAEAELASDTREVDARLFREIIAPGAIESPAPPSADAETSPTTRDSYRIPFFIVLLYAIVATILLIGLLTR